MLEKFIFANELLGEEVGKNELSLEITFMYLILTNMPVSLFTLLTNKICTTLIKTGSVS